MAATNSRPATSAEEIRGALTEHVKLRSYRNIVFRENLNPSHEPRLDDYRVTYEAEFVPRDLMHAYIKLVVSEDGKCGVGVETRARVAERVGTYLLTGKTAFAAGKELMTIGAKELVYLVTIIANGKFVIKVNRGLVDLGKTYILVPREEARDITIRDDRTWDWILFTETLPDRTWRSRILTYDPW